MTTLGTNFGRLDAHSHDVAALLLVSVKSPLSRNCVPVVVVGLDSWGRDGGAWRALHHAGAEGPWYMALRDSPFLTLPHPNSGLLERR